MSITVPTFYLKVVPWHEALITADDIRGTHADIRRLADLIESRLVHCEPRQSFIIDTDYSAQNEFQLHFHVREQGFDPAVADPLLSLASTKKA